MSCVVVSSFWNENYALNIIFPLIAYALMPSLQQFLSISFTHTQTQKHENTKIGSALNPQLANQIEVGNQTLDQISSLILDTGKEQTEVQDAITQWTEGTYACF